MRRKWESIGISRDVYVSSDGHYTLRVFLRDDPCSAVGLTLDYSDGYWLYHFAKSFREYHAPKYVVAMFTAKFAEMYAADAFTFYEYRKVGDALVKDDDPASLRYHDAERWRWVAEGIVGDGKEDRNAG
jgi:hypothetical protein